MIKIRKKITKKLKRKKEGNGKKKRKMTMKKEKTKNKKKKKMEMKNNIEFTPRRRRGTYFKLLYITCVSVLFICKTPVRTFTDM